MKFSISVLLFLTWLNYVSVCQSKLIVKKSNGQSTTFNLSEISSISFITNLIQNGDFNDSLDHWLMNGVGPNPYHPTDPGRADFTIENGILTIDIKDQGVDLWSVMLYQSVYFEKGVTYNITFEAKSDFPCEIISNITQDNTWINFSGNREFNLTNSMTTYSYEFTMPQNGPALFQYYLGIIGTGKIYFDNIVIVRK